MKYHRMFSVADDADSSAVKRLFDFLSNLNIIIIKYLLNTNILVVSLPCET